MSSIRRLKCCRVLSALLICLLGSVCQALPTGEMKYPSITTNRNNESNSVNNMKPNRHRQDGEDAIEDPGFNQVAAPIAQIISGSLSGNFNQLFNGIGGTVTDQEVQPGVGAILQGVALPLQNFWSQAIKGGQKYFNISTTENPSMATKVTGGVSQQKLTPQQIAALQQHVQAYQQQQKQMQNQNQGPQKNPQVQLLSQAQTQQNQNQKLQQIQVIPVVQQIPQQQRPHVVIPVPIAASVLQSQTQPTQAPSTTPTTSSPDDDDDEETESEKRLAILKAELG